MMKSLLLSIAILIVSLSFTVVGTKLTDNSLNDIEDALKSGYGDNGDDALECWQNLDNIFSKVKTRLCLMVDDEEIREIENYIYEIKAAAENHSAEEFGIAKSRLESHIRQLRRLYTLSIESIF